MNRLVLTLACWVLCGGAAVAAGCDITGKVCRLQPGTAYNPAAFLTGMQYTKPTLDCASASLNNHKEQIQALIDDQDTDDGFRNEICGLTNIIISPTARSFGKYEDPSQNQSGAGAPPVRGDGSQYVLLQQNILLKPFGELAGQSVLDLTGANGQTLKDRLGIRLTHTPAGPRRKQNTPLALTYALAHEIGHIRFHRIKAPNLACFQNDIEGASWVRGSTPNITTPEGRWRDYEDQRFGTHLINIKKPQEVQTTQDIAAIYNDGFASALAAASTEEDYVESYTLAVLSKFSTDDLALDLAGSGVVQVKGRAGNRTLQQKLACAIQ